MVLKLLQQHLIAKGKSNVSTSRSVGTAGGFRILSHNVGQDLPDYNGLDSLIYRVDAEIVLLQEITRDYVDGHWAKLSHNYPHLSHGPFVEQKQVASGILSKYPLLKVDNFKLADIGIVPQQHALIDIEGKVVSMYNIHLTFPWVKLERIPFFPFVPWPKFNHRTRSEETDKLIEMITEDNYPTLAAGDFNFTSRSDDYKKLTGIVTDAYCLSGERFGFSWPANRTPSLYIPLAIPLVRIDYVFHSCSLHTRMARFLPKTGSDHLPLLVEIVLS